MIGCFSNIRGVELPNKQKFLQDLFKEEGISFIGLSETIKSDYTSQWFNKIAGNRKFTWQWIPPEGRSGGMLLGADLDLFDLIEYELGKFFIRMLLVDKHSKLKWHLVSVYGPAQQDKKNDFLTELAGLCGRCK